MNPDAPLYFLFVGLGFALALAMEFFDRTKFAKEHRVINTIGELALVALLCYASVYFTHNFSSWLLPLFGFWVTARLKEGRDKRRNFNNICADLTARAETALAARDGAEAVEIDLAGTPESARWQLIHTYKKQGLTVETVKNESTGTLKLRLSGQRLTLKD